MPRSFHSLLSGSNRYSLHFMSTSAFSASSPVCRWGNVRLCQPSIHMVDLAVADTPHSLIIQQRTNLPELGSDPALVAAPSCKAD